MGSPPPAGLVSALLDGPSALAGFAYHPSVTSTNTLAAEDAAAGVPEIHAVAADVQQAGRGRLGRTWQAPAGSSLLVSFVLRPGGADPATLPLLVGDVLAEVLTAYLRRDATDPAVTLKWPNDVLVAEAKVAGILLERHGDAVIAGIGCNVDWRGLARPAELAAATSLAEVIGAPVDRWKLFAALVGVLDRRYAVWRRDPRPTLAAYRARCATIGQRVRIERAGLDPLEGVARAVTDDGRLEVVTGQPEVVTGRPEALTGRSEAASAAEAVVTVDAGDVVHLRAASHPR